MTALVRYELATLLRSQRWVGPLVTYLGLLAFVYASSAGPAVQAFGVTGYALFVVSAWLTAATLSAENEIARQVTAVTAGSQRRVQVAALVAAGTAGAVLAVLAVLAGLVANATATAHATAVVGGLALHALFVLLGASVGALLGRPLVDGPGQSALGILAVAMLALVVPGSPVLACLRVLETDPVHGFAGRLLPAVAMLLAVALAGLGFSVARTPART